MNWNFLLFKKIYICYIITLKFELTSLKNANFLREIIGFGLLYRQNKLSEELKVARKYIFDLVACQTKDDVTLVNCFQN